MTEKTKVKMDKAVTYARGVVYDGVERIKGRVSSGIFRFRFNIVSGTDVFDSSA